MRLPLQPINVVMYPCKNICSNKIEWNYFLPIADKSSVHHMRYYPLCSMGLTILSFKRHLMWEEFFSSHNVSLFWLTIDVGLLVPSTLLEPHLDRSLIGRFDASAPDCAISSLSAWTTPTQWYLDTWPRSTNQNQIIWMF